MKSVAPSRRRKAPQGRRHSGRVTVETQLPARCAVPDAAGRPAAPGPAEPPPGARATRRAGARARRRAATRAARGRSPRTGRAGPPAPAARRPGRPVQSAQLLQHHADRPAVGDDVVQGRQQHVLPGAQPQQDRAQQRTPGEIERPHRRVVRQPRRLGLAAGRGQAARGRPAAGPAAADGSITWTGLPALSRNRVRRASWRRTISARLPASAAGRPVPSAAGPPGCCRRRTARLEPVEEPEALLGERQRQDLVGATLPRQKRRRRAPLVPQLRLDPRRQGRHRRRLEQGGQRQLGAEQRPGPRDDAGGQQRVPAQAKKSSSTPTRSIPSTSAQIPARSSSAGVRGAAKDSPLRRSGAGRARRSSLPLAVRGSSVRNTQAEGIM